MRLADGDVGVADFLPDGRADGDFPGLHKGDFAVFVGDGSIERRDEPEFDGVGKRLACGILGYRFELDLTADGRASGRRSNFDGGNLGGFFRFLLRRWKVLRGRSKRKKLAPMRKTVTAR